MNGCAAGWHTWGTTFTERDGALYRACTACGEECMDRTVMRERERAEGDHADALKLRLRAERRREERQMERAEERGR